MEYSIDHAVLFVENLDVATEEFTELGFQVTPGGTHAGGLTENALILLADGTYLELLGFTVPLESLTGVKQRTALDRRFVPRGRAGQGLRDFACGATRLQDAVDHARAAGVELEGPFPGGRTRPDGTELAWQLAFPTDDVLPFLIEDVTDRALRVPGGDATRHRNGATGIAELAIQVDDADAAAELYRRLLNLESVTRADAVAFHLANATVTLTQCHARSFPSKIRLHAAAGRAGDALECCGVRIEFGNGD